ncbi:MAG: hypothetical protein AAF434_11100 [Pseudomonadota bacterium]
MALDQPISEHDPHPASTDLEWIVDVRWHSYASCYVWYDSPSFDRFGDSAENYKANTIYVNRAAEYPQRDLLHEIGHVVGRYFNTVNHRENKFVGGSWENRSGRLIGAVSAGRHWSTYLNWYANNTKAFKFNCASELWAELFMLYYIEPTRPESKLIEDELGLLRKDIRFVRLETILREMIRGRGKRI